jgi:hypothetical protein
MVQLNGLCRSILWQFKQLSKLLLIIYVPITLIIIGLAAQRQIPVLMLVDDIAAFTEMPFYTGIVSNAGVLVWTTTAAVCWFIYAFGRITEQKKEIQWFILGSALITSYLGLDDLLMLHDSVLIYYFNVSELISYGLYGSLVTAYLISFRHTIAETDYLLLVLALGLFAVSILVDSYELFMSPELISSTRDQFNQTNTASKDLDSNIAPFKISTIRYLVEEGAKFMGIVAWAAYFIRFCWQVMIKRLNNSGKPA